MERAQAKWAVPIPMVVLATLLLAGCDHGDGHTLIVDIDSPTAPSDNAKVEGVWNAAITYESGRQATGILSLDQSHPFDWEVIGTFTTESSTSELSGSVAGQLLSLTATPRQPCSGSFAVLATVAASNRVMDGSLDGETCKGEIVATFRATKR